MHPSQYPYIQTECGEAMHAHRPVWGHGSGTQTRIGPDLGPCRRVCACCGQLVNRRCQKRKMSVNRLFP